VEVLTSEDWWPTPCCSLFILIAARSPSRASPSTWTSSGCSRSLGTWPWMDEAFLETVAMFCTIATRSILLPSERSLNQVASKLYPSRHGVQLWTPMRNDGYDQPRMSAYRRSFSSVNALCGGRWENMLSITIPSEITKGRAMSSCSSPRESAAVSRAARWALALLPSTRCVNRSSARIDLGKLAVRPRPYADNDCLCWWR